MKTRQRSPNRIGSRDANANCANSPLIATPNFSACSSKNEPVPAAQASFMVKSTTTPSRIRMNFESCPPISKIVSTSGIPIWRQTCVAPVLCAVISSFTVSAPVSSPISSLPDPVVPTPRMLTRAPSPSSSRTVPRRRLRSDGPRWKRKSPSANCSSTRSLPGSCLPNPRRCQGRRPHGCVPAAVRAAAPVRNNVTWSSESASVVGNSSAPAGLALQAAECARAAFASFFSREHARAQRRHPAVQFWNQKI